MSAEGFNYIEAKNKKKSKEKEKELSSGWGNPEEGCFWY